MSEMSNSISTRRRAKPVHPRETVLFYRGYGCYSPAGDCWHLDIHGNITAPSRKHLRKTALLHLLKRVVKPERNSEVSQRFLDRAHLFLTDRRKGKSVPIAIAERSFTLPDSTHMGDFQTTITVPDGELTSAAQDDPFGRKFVEFCTQLPVDDERMFCGDIELIPQHGISVISDVDDTIKDSNVANKRELLANTFTREFQSVDGMSDVYRNWAKCGASFHYVSASPWPLYAPLHEWLDKDKFPRGSIHLRHVGLRELRKDKNRDKAFQDKRSKIERIMRTFPSREFLLIGDSGERDAELYVSIAEQFGHQVKRICIRDTQHSQKNNTKVMSNLNRLHPDRWLMFQNPDELSAVIE